METLRSGATSRLSAAVLSPVPSSIVSDTEPHGQLRRRLPPTLPDALVDDDGALSAIAFGTDRPPSAMMAGAHTFPQADQPVPGSTTIRTFQPTRGLNPTHPDNVHVTLVSGDDDDAHVTGAGGERGRGSPTGSTVSMQLDMSAATGVRPSIMAPEDGTWAGDAFVDPAVMPDRAVHEALHILAPRALRQWAAEVGGSMRLCVHAALTGMSTLQDALTEQPWSRTVLLDELLSTLAKNRQAWADFVAQTQQYLPRFRTALAALEREEQGVRTVLHQRLGEASHLEASGCGSSAADHTLRSLAQVLARLATTGEELRANTLAYRKQLQHTYLDAVRAMGEEARLQLGLYRQNVERVRDRLLTVQAARRAEAMAAEQLRGEVDDSAEALAQSLQGTLLDVMREAGVEVPGAIAAWLAASSSVAPRKSRGTQGGSRRWRDGIRVFQAAEARVRRILSLLDARLADHHGQSSASEAMATAPGIDDAQADAGRADDARILQLQAELAALRAAMDRAYTEALLLCGGEMAHCAQASPLAATHGSEDAITNGLAGLAATRREIQDDIQRTQRALQSAMASTRHRPPLGEEHGAGEDDARASNGPRMQAARLQLTAVWNALQQRINAVTRAWQACEAIDAELRTLAARVLHTELTSIAEGLWQTFRRLSHGCKVSASGDISMHLRRDATLTEARQVLRTTAQHLVDQLAQMCQRDFAMAQHTLSVLQRAEAHRLLMADIEHITSLHQRAVQQHASLAAFMGDVRKAMVWDGPAGTSL